MKKTNVKNFPIYDEELDEWDSDLECDLIDIRDKFLEEEDAKSYFEEIVLQFCVEKARNRKI